MSTRLGPVRSYACYYGAGQLAALARRSLVILQPGHYGPSDLAELRAAGTRALAYLSLGETASAGPETPWLLRDGANGLATNAEWGTHYIDMRSEAFAREQLEEVIPAVLGRGFDGLFLDGLDAQDRFPMLRDAAVALVRSIRGRLPDAVLVANRAFTILDRIVDSLDGVMFESFTSYCRAGRYYDWSDGDLAWSEERARALRTLCPSLLVLALDYAHPDDRARIAASVGRARAHGFVPYVGTMALDRLGPEL